MFLYRNPTIHIQIMSISDLFIHKANNKDKYNTCYAIAIRGYTATDSYWCQSKIPPVWFMVFTDAQWSSNFPFSWCSDWMGTPISLVLFNYVIRIRKYFYKKRFRIRSFNPPWMILKRQKKRSHRELDLKTEWIIWFFLQI